MSSFRLFGSALITRWNTALVACVSVAVFALAVLAEHTWPAVAANAVAPENTVSAPEDEDNSLYGLTAAWSNEHGNTLQLSSLAGRVQVVAMVYTNCHSTCPLIISELKRIEASLKAEQRDKVGFVLVSLDPDRDTPARLSEWSASIELDPAHWTLLSSNQGATRELAAALNVRYQPQSNGELAHTNGLAVLDRRGVLVHQQLGLGETAASIQVVQSLLK